MTYEQFIRQKATVSKCFGHEIEDSEIHPLLKPHQRVAVRWAVRGGRRALFEAFGLGKTFQQIECLRLVLKHFGGRALIVAPLGVRQEFIGDGRDKLCVDIRFIRRIEEAGKTGIYITNYETVRDGKLDPGHFTATSLDEASILRGFGGTKTFREFMRLFEQVRFRFVATATPDPTRRIASDGRSNARTEPRWATVCRNTCCCSANRRQTRRRATGIPVTKSKKRYSKARWQLDAHGFTRSSGNRPFTPEEILDMPLSKDFHQKMFGMFHDFYCNNVFDFEHAVKIGEALEVLPVTFMLLQPPSVHPDVWTDITRMLTANISQVNRKRQKHLCPMQFDLADRVITQMSNDGDVVYDPFAGVGTVPMRAVALGRFGVGCELNNGYFLDAVAYAEAESRGVKAPTLFDSMEEVAVA